MRVWGFRVSGRALNSEARSVLKILNAKPQSVPASRTLTSPLTRPPSGVARDAVFSP